MVLAKEKILSGLPNKLSITAMVDSLVILCRLIKKPLLLTSTFWAVVINTKEKIRQAVSNNFFIPLYSHPLK
jgi:hypothetical protein